MNLKKYTAMGPSRIEPKREMTFSNVNNNNDDDELCPPPLKISKDSRLIKKSSSSSSPSLMKPQLRQPVIIYTHSPKVIHTHPQNFMALVQKLTGLSRNGDEDGKNSSSNSYTSNNKSSQRKLESGNGVESESVKFVGNEDNECSSVVTEEHNCSNNNVGDGQVNSCLMTPPIFEPPPPPPLPPNSYMANFPMFMPNLADYLSSHKTFFNYTDSLFFNHNMRHSGSSSAKLEGRDEYSEY